ncbi:MAG: hypothetical protein QOJ19_2054 [Acidimicrobiia bacterium]|jgi:hypothetical protein|nr:hypothetical protein [Acidimicrobiia bacterium]
MCEIARRIESECRLKNLTRSVGDGPRGGSEGHGLLAGAFCFLRPQDFSGFRCHPSRRAVRVPPDRRRTENQIPGQRVAGDQDRPERPSITYVRRCGSVFPGAHMLSFTGLETASMALPPEGGSTTCRPVPRERCGTRDRRPALEEHVGASAGHCFACIGGRHITGESTGRKRRFHKRSFPSGCHTEEMPVGPCPPSTGVAENPSRGKTCSRWSSPAAHPA